jgi:hypothetical protein
MDIDPRGLHFAALITTVVLAVVLVTGSIWLLAARAVAFAVGGIFGLALVHLWPALPAAGRGGRGLPGRCVRVLPGL